MSGIGERGHAEGCGISRRGLWQARAPAPGPGSALKPRARFAGLRGVSAEQDGRFRNKEKALLKKLEKTFPAEFAVKVDLTSVNWDVMKPWIAKRVTELLGLEDDVVIGYVNEQLEGNKVRLCVGCGCSRGWGCSRGSPGQAAHSARQQPARQQSAPCQPRRSPAALARDAPRACLPYRLSTRASSRSTSPGSWRRTPASSARCGRAGALARPRAAALRRALGRAELAPRRPAHRSCGPC